MSILNQYKDQFPTITKPIEAASPALLLCPQSPPNNISTNPNLILSAIELFRKDQFL